MRLLDEFFSIRSSEKTETAYRYAVSLNADHFIYKAHFPGEPITPGVCILQTAQELAEVALQRKLYVKEVKNIKFLNIISPIDNADVCFELKISGSDEDRVCVQAVVSNENTTFAKLSFVCMEG